MLAWRCSAAGSGATRRSRRRRRCTWWSIARWCGSSRRRRGERRTRASCSSGRSRSRRASRRWRRAGGIGEGYQERDVRAALEHDVAEQMLASLAEKLIADSPADKRPGLGEVPRVEADCSARRCSSDSGGRARVDEAAQRRAARRGRRSTRSCTGRRWPHGTSTAPVTPLLHPSDEQLRDVYRTSAHPYRGSPSSRCARPSRAGSSSSGCASPRPRSCSRRGRACGSS